MVVALAIIWIGFQIMSGGLFLTARNLWNLSVQSASIAIMATGMVLIIVSRNIDLSVGSMLGFLGYTMAMVQAQWIPNALHLGFNQPYTWLIALAVGLVVGAAIGGFQGLIVAYGGVPSFIVTLGGFLIWRGLIFAYAQGQTIGPMDGNFALLGGGPSGSLGEVSSWVVGAVACAGIVFTVINNRRQRQTYGFPVRPIWALATVIAVSCAVVLGAVSVANSYLWPEALAHQYALAHNIPEPPGGLRIPVGIAYPVLILVGVALAMTFLATRRRFGRYVFAIGGNPEAADLGGINGSGLPANFTATANALEGMAFAAKDALLVVDDFAPTGRQSDTCLQGIAERLFRAAGNQQGRSRLAASGRVCRELVVVLQLDIRVAGALE